MGTEEFDKSKFKKTKVGIIPIDWRVEKVKDIYDEVTRGKVLPKKKIKEGKDEKYKYPVYSSQTLDNGLLGYYDQYLFEDALTWTTDGANAGKVSYRPNRFYCTNVSGVLLSEKGYANECMAAILNRHTPRYVSYVGNPKLMNNVMKDILIPVPTWSEQQKIASILSTWDEAIEKYQNLLELIKLEKEGIAHRAIVQNAPQIGGYRKYKIGEILAYEQPQKHLENDISEEKDKDSVPVLTANKAFVLGYSKNLEGTYHEYPAIIFDDFTTDIKYVDFEFKVRSSAIKILSPKSDDINLKYVYETMNLIRFPLGGHKRHYISEYQYIKVGLPPKEYQDKIANLLTNMDEKIELIDSMIENLKEQKRGLMQLLLTGKVRV